MVMFRSFDYAQDDVLLVEGDVLLVEGDVLLVEGDVLLVEGDVLLSSLPFWAFRCFVAKDDVLTLRINVSICPLGH
jgi:hypothetical protein